MTCHSRAGQMFIDAQYQPHSSSVRVTALAAMSPATPTHLALPPHSSGGREQQFLSGVLMGGCWAVTVCFHTIKGEGSLAFIYLLHFFFSSHSRRLAKATVQHHCHLSRAIAPALLPFVMWKQPFSCGDFPSFHPDAWHSWQIGCGSEGDGLWKQCLCPHYTHCGHIHEGSLTHKCVDVAHVCVRNLTLNTFSHSLLPWDKSERLRCKQGDDLDVKHTKKRKQKM